MYFATATTGLSNKKLKQLQQWIARCALKSTKGRSSSTLLALIGDPSGRSEMRPRMTVEDVNANAQTYKDQVHKILDMGKLEIRFNREWCWDLNFAEVLQLASHYTVARMLERDDFAKRYQDGRPISITEFFYPLVQGYDSVALEADVELGGTDQKFNLLVGRHMQEAHGLEPQVILTLPLLEGTGGGDKMSKSLGNIIGIMEPAEEIFGKTMSIPDSLMPSYLRLASGFPRDEYEEDIRQLEAGTVSPVLLKRKLARGLADLYCGPGAGEAAERAFDRIFVKKDLPDEMPEFTLETGEGGQWLVGILDEAGLVKSRGEARRLIKQGAVSVDGEKVSADDHSLASAQPREWVIKVGKRRFLKVIAR